jgi:glycosyltransferase involved in cell wall biosynthesis
VSGERIKVLYVDTGMGFGGGQASLVEVLRRLDRSVFEPVVSSPQAGPLADRCRSLGVTWLALPFGSAGGPGVAAGGAGAADGGAAGPGAQATVASRAAGASGLRDIASSFRGILHLGFLTRSLGADIVHLNTFKAGLVGGLACLLARRPAVFHDRTQLGHGALGLVVDALAKRIVVVSRAVAAKHRWPARAKTRLVYDGVDTERFRPAGGRASAGVAARAGGPADARVGYLGRITEEKGLAYLVESAPAVFEGRPGARVAVAGSPLTARDHAYLGGVRKRLGQLGIAERFEFMGEVEDARRFLEGVDVVVVPSEREGLGLVVLEAGAMAKPVVAFAVGGITETVTDGENGLLVRRGDVAGLAGSIGRLLDRPREARAMGARARKVVEERFSVGAMALALSKVYLELLGRSAAHARARGAARGAVRGEP